MVLIRRTFYVVFDENVFFFENCFKIKRKMIVLKNERMEYPLNRINVEPDTVLI